MAVGEDPLNPFGPADLRALLALIVLYYGTGLPLAKRLARGAGGPVLAWALPCSLAVLLGALFLARLIGLDLSGATGVIAAAVVAAMLGPLVLERKGRWREFRQRSSRAAEAGTVADVAGEARPAREDAILLGVRPFEWAVIGVLGVVLLAAGGPLGITTDTFAHLTTIRRSLLGDAILPTDNFYRGGDGIGWDPRYGFLHPLHAFVCRLARVDPLNLWRVLPAVMAPGVLLAVSRFLRVWTGPRRRGDLALLAWVLVGAGSGFLWLLRTGYPNHVAYPLSFLALAVAIDYLLPRDADSGTARNARAAMDPGRTDRAPLLAVAMLGFVGALIHLVAPVLLLAGLGFVGAGVLSDRSLRSGRSGPSGPHDAPARLRRLGLAGVAAVAGMIGPLTFRLLTQGRVDSTLHTHPQGLLVLGGGWLLASPVAVLRQVGFAGLLALLVLPLAARSVPPGRRLAFVFLALAPWVCVWTPLFTPLTRVLGYLVTRLLVLLPVGAVLVLALEEAGRRLRSDRAPVDPAGASPAPGRSRRPVRRIATAALAGGLVLFAAGRAAVLQVGQIRRALTEATGEDAPRADSGAFALIRSMVEVSPSRPPVVLADPFTSYALGGLTGAHLVTTLNQHGPPFDRRWRDRIDDQREVLLGTVDEVRADSLLAAYQVDLVFVNSGLSMPVTEFGARIEPASMEQARRNIEGAPERFPAIYRGSDGLVTRVRPSPRGKVAPPEARPPSDSTASAWPAAAASDETARAGRADEACVVNAGPFVLGAISAINVALPARPVARGERLWIALEWVRHGDVGTDLPLIAHVRASTAVPRRWFFHPAWSKPARLLSQRIDHRLYRFRVGRPPLAWERNPARLPLREPAPDRLLVIIPPTAAPGEYVVTLSLAEETLLPNVTLRDLLRDDDSFEGPVVGRITVQ